MDDSKIWKWLSRITALWGVVIFIWSLLSYFNIAPFYEIRLIPKNSVEPYINVFSGQDIQLDFDKASYFRNAEIQKVKWEISGGKNSYSALGPRPIFKLPESYEGIYNLTLEVLLETNKKLYGKTSIYVVQQKTSFVRRTKTINFHIGEKMSSNALYFNSPKSAVQSIKKIEIYTSHHNINNDHRE